MMPGDTGNAGAASVVAVEIEDIDALYAAYMPFISNGGLFVHAHRLGDDSRTLGMALDLQLRLKSENECLPVRGRVVWVTHPDDRQHATGVGVQFCDGGETQRRLELLLTGRLRSEQPTLTL